MTPRVPSCTARQILVALQRAGWEINHTVGSHHQLKHPDKPGRKVTIAMHPGDLPRRVLFRILKQADLSQAEFLELL